MKNACKAVALCLLFTASCSGHDVDLGNGVDPVQSTGGAGKGGESTTMSSSSALPGTTGSPGTSGGGNSVVTGPNTPGTSSVTTGGGAAGSGGSSGAAGGAADSGIPSGPATAIVMRYGDIPPTVIGSGTGSTTAGGGTIIDPDTPYLFVGNGPPTCGDPYADSQCGHWVVIIGIPRSLFQPGILSLADRRLTSVMSFRGPYEDGGSCYGGGGSFLDGTLEIVDAGASVSIRLANTTTLEFNANGSYQVARCP